MSEPKSQAILDAEREYQEAERVAQEAIAAQNAAKKRLNLLEIEAEFGIRIGDTLEWIERGRSKTSDGWHFSPMPDRPMRGVVVDIKYGQPVVRLFRNDGTLGEGRQTVYFPRPSGSTMIITHAEVPHE